MHSSILSLKVARCVLFHCLVRQSVVSPGGQPVLESAASLQTASTAQDQVLCLTVVIKREFPEPSCGFGQLVLPVILCKFCCAEFHPILPFSAMRIFSHLPH